MIERFFGLVFRQLPFISLAFMLAVFSSAALLRWSDPLQSYVMVMNEVEGASEQEFLLRMCDGLDSNARAKFVQQLVNSEDVHAHYYAIALQSHFSVSEEEFQKFKSDCLARWANTTSSNSDSWPLINYYRPAGMLKETNAIQFREW